MLNLHALPEAASAVLKREPELLARISQALDLPPFPAAYSPQRIEIAFDDVPYLVCDHGVTIYSRPCPEGYVPNFVEWQFDGECAWFQVGDCLLVDRVKFMAEIAEFVRR